MLSLRQRFLPPLGDRRRLTARDAAVFAVVLAGVFATALFSPVITVKTAPAAPQFRATIPSPEHQLALRGEIDLRDSEPLYLPTRWNFGHNTGNAAPRRNSEFNELAPEAFAPELRAREGAPLPLGAIPVPATPPLENLLPLRYWRAADSLGIQPVPPQTMPPPRQAYLRVERVSDSVVFFEETLHDIFPTEEAASRWQPAAFTIWVDLQGIVGAPVAVPWIDGTTGPGNAIIADAMRRHLSTPEFLARIPPGYYRVNFGP
ncbi:MAG: hypothetical protein LBT53_06470 [Puniceicoccales bacterium]|jgi:hypothetical protein|nr:hypothetical protein [Puniceicoccales bacterium]